MARDQLKALLESLIFYTKANVLNRAARVMMRGIWEGILPDLLPMYPLS